MSDSLEYKGILVTGGAGYIGTFVVKQLLDNGYRVTVLDDLIYGDSGMKPFWQHGNLKFIRGDICDSLVVDYALKDVDAVIALAAIVGAPACDIDREKTLEVNYHSIKTLIDRSRKNNVRRIIFASTCSVYGANSQTQYLDENSRLESTSLYAETKINSEALLLKNREYFIPVILRLSTVYGVSPRMRFDLSINIMSAKAERDKHIVVFGGDQWRPFVHVRDAANAFVTALETEESLVAGQIFNVGSNGSNYQMKDVALAVAEEVPGTYVEQDSSIVDARNYHVAFDKIEKNLGYTTNLGIRDGIREISIHVRDNCIDIMNAIYHNVKVWREIHGKRGFVAFARPDVGVDEKKEILDVIDSGWLSTGPKVKDFETKLSEYFGDNALNTIAVSSCTAGLHLQLLAAGVGPGDEVITSPMTFCSTVNTIMYTGAKPVLVDIESKTFNIDIEKIEERITERTKAIVPVYYAGQPVDLGGLQELAKKYSLLVLADAAHAMGAKYNDKYVGTIEDSAAFSFYATKPMTTGEGGLVTTKNDEFADKIRVLLLHGMDRDAWRRYAEKGNWYYEITVLGYKYNMTDIQAAMGMHQLEKLDLFNEIREQYAQIYNTAFRDHNVIQIPFVKHNVVSTHHLYPILLNTERLTIDRKRFIEILKENNIGTSVHYIPINYHPFYQKSLNCKKGDFPVTEWVFNRIVSLPLYTKLAKGDLTRVIEVILSTVDSYSK